MRLTLIALGLVLVSACSSGGSQEAAPEPTVSASPDACVEVRAGIDAFNEGDYDETVIRFRKAIPLAVDQAEDDDSQAAADLVEAVTYYADLSPADYPESARSSDDFARYKAITLGQCMPAEQPNPEETPDQVA